MDKLMATLLKMANDIADLRRDVEDLKRREIPAGLWKAWTPASYTGWTALPGGTYRYALFGNVVLLVISMTSGTSNATTAKIALPFQASGQTFIGTNGYATDNGTGLTAASRWVINASSTTIDFYKDMGVGAWTTSGTKRIYCVAMYERV